MRRYRFSYGKEVDDAIDKIFSLLLKDKDLVKKYNLNWLAIKLLEGDEEVKERVKNSLIYQDVIKVVEKLREKLEEKYGDMDVYFADKRYDIISSITRYIIKKRKEVLTFSDILDKVFLNKYIGIPLFISLMWVVFQFTFSVAAPFVDAIDTFFTFLADYVNLTIKNKLLASLVADGIINGVGSVLVFVPNIFFLFFAMSILEDSGYMARVAFIMDKIMRKFGLGGRSVIPLLLGFGCNVPAIMTTRTVPTKEDRILTILVNPLISCSARLPVYVLIGGALFASNAGNVILSLYLLGITLALILAYVFRKIFFGGKPSPLILELPHYLVPNIRTTILHMWERGRMFVRKAGTIIFLGVVLIWLFSHLPPGINSVEDSFVGIFGKTILPIFQPLGFNDWRIPVSLSVGFVAKEIVIGSLGQFYGATGEELNQVMQQIFTPASAYAFMAFTLIYIPCLATIAVIKNETGSYKWTLFTIVYGLVLAYFVALLVVTIGGLIGG